MIAAFTGDRLVVGTFSVGREFPHTGAPAGPNFWQ